MTENAIRSKMPITYSPPDIVKSLNIGTTIGDQSIKAKALLLPANGSEIKLVSYAIIERGDEDGNIKADFYDPIPDLRP